MRKLSWLHVLGIALAGLVGPAKAGVLSQEQSAAARKLYVNKCAKCHKMYDPAKYSDDQWNTWMDKMGAKSKLKPEQKEAVSKYIEQTFRQPPKAREPALGTAKR
jgi:mono/diheme cytochrome c family protein